jgi:hypothetical protein
VADKNMMDDVANKKQKTKEYRDKIRHRKVIQIPKRNDVSLFQKVNCVEGLPIPIFQIIQEYCNEKDYRNLVNTNLSTFQPIKWETVKYSLIGPTKWDKMSPYKINQREERLLNIINNNVKDKSNQISMSFWNVKPPTLTKYSYLFQGITKLHFTGGELCGSFHAVSLDIFKDLRCLTLEKYHGDKVLNVDWERLVRLELVECDFSVIENLNSTQTLKHLKIENPSGSVRILCSLDNVEHIEITSRFWDFLEMQFPKNCRDFELRFDSAKLKYNKDCDEVTVRTSDGNQSYERLVISCSFLEFDPRLVEQWALYSVVEVKSSCREGQFPSFPIPRGENISLTSFNLSSWNGNVLRNLKELVLLDITNLDISPEMPRVESVSLEKVSGLRILPGLPKLTTLVMKKCDSLERIDFCPKLEKAELWECSNLKDISSCAHVKALELVIMESLTTLIGFKGNENTFVNDRREIALWDLTHLWDFSFCQYLYQLELSRLPELLSCEGISNIHNLEISQCHGLTSTAGLRSISGKIHIHNCDSLLSVLDLQNIPEVEIDNCRSLTDFSGLGHNKMVKIGSRETAKSFEKFQEENPTIVESIEQLTVSKWFSVARIQMAVSPF